MRTRSKENTMWRFADEGIQLIARLWWVAYIAPSEKQPGKWYWKTTTNPEVKKGYADSPEMAIKEVRDALLMDDEFEYILPDDSTALHLFKRIEELRQFAIERAARKKMREFDPVI